MSRFGFDTDLSILPFDDLFAYRQAYPRSFVLLAGMEPFEHLEDSLVKFVLYPDTVIANLNPYLIVVGLFG